MYREIKGDLIQLALNLEFDVIAHGCNCFCNMGAGIAPQMAKAFGCDKFNLEHSKYRGDINKLGNIEAVLVNGIYVINAYTQYGFGKNHVNGKDIALDYEALTLCMRKINTIFKGKRIGLPKIGAGLAGGNWEKIKEIMQTELVDCNLTIVIYE